MNKERYVLLSLFGLAPPLIWVLHFAFIYLAQQFLCNHYGNDTSEGDALVKNTIIMVSAFIVIAMTIFIIRIPEFLKRIMEIKNESATYSEDTVKFMNQITMVLAGLSVIAIIWSTISAIFLNACSMPY